MAVESSTMAIVQFRKGFDQDDSEEKFLSICYESDVDRANEDEDDLNQRLPGIYYWSNFNDDIFNIILSMAIEKLYNHSIQRARGPTGSLADRIRMEMFNGREVSSVCSSLLFFNFPISFSQRRLRIFDCVVKDVGLISPPQYAPERFAILNRKPHCRWFFPSRDPRFNERDQVLDVLITGVEDKVVLWTGFNLKHPFTFVLNADYHIRWEFQPCKNDFVLARQILPPPGQRLQVVILHHTVVGHRLIVTVAVNKNSRPPAYREEKLVNAQAFHMVLDVNTTEWSFLDQNGFKSDNNDVFFSWNERFYVWNLSTNFIRYFDFHIGEWVLSGPDLENLRRPFAQLRQIFKDNFTKWKFSHNPLETYPYLIVLVASRSGTLYCINNFCTPAYVGDHLVYAMNDINDGWNSVNIFKYSQNPGFYNNLLRSNPGIYWFGTQFCGMSQGPHCWPAGKDSILVLFQKMDEDSYRYSWFIINERDGIQEFNDIEVPVQFVNEKNFLPVFVENHLVKT